MNNIKLQGFIAYFGLIPALTVVIDAYFIETISQSVIRNFMLYYSIIIFTFIGAMIWQLKPTGSITRTLYGTIPSLISFLLIVMNLIGYDYQVIATTLMVSLLLQCFCDRFIYYENRALEDFYIYVRIPVTLTLVFFIFIVI